MKNQNLYFSLCPSKENVLRHEKMTPLLPSIIFCRSPLVTFLPLRSSSYPTGPSTTAFQTSLLAIISYMQVQLNTAIYYFLKVTSDHVTFCSKTYCYLFITCKIKSKFLDLTKNQFSSVAKLCPTLCSPMDCSMPGFPVHHQLPVLAQTHVPQVGDAIQPAHPLSSSSPPAFNLSHHQGLFQSVFCIRWPKCWSFSFSISPSNEYSGLTSFMMDWLDLLAVQQRVSPRLF